MSDFTLEQIKDAFWETFHEEGEMFFEYSGTEEEKLESTDYWFDQFVETLEQTKKGDRPR